MSFVRTFLLALTLLLAPVVATADDSEASRLIALVNEFRAAHELAPVALEAKLSAAAQEHAEAMAASGKFSHDAPDGNLTERMGRANYAFATVTENIGEGSPTAKETVAMWAQSPPHARNLLNESVREAGIGHAKAPGKYAADFWCLILAAPAPP